MAGTDKQKAFGEVAFAAYVPHNYPLDKLEPGLERERVLRSDQLHLPGGHATSARWRSTRETGATEIDRFTAVDDFGKIINPMIVEGQVHGGLAQGIGQALLRGLPSTTTSGQLLTGSLHGLLPCRAPATSRRSRSTPARRRARTTRSA